jgi:hypothetical protein
VSVQANEPYQNLRYDVNGVRPGTDIDLGEIRLHRQ